MRVFISFSGTTSRRVATALHAWIPSVLQSAKPWMSSEDIEKGGLWMKDIGSGLRESGFGIVCVTADNLDSQWLNFEAGVLSFGLETAKVSPFLLGVDHSALIAGPLGQFQAVTRATERDDVLRLVHSINNESGAEAIGESLLVKSFEKFWEDLKSELESIGEELADESDPELDQAAALTLILEIVRSNQRALRSTHQPGGGAQSLVWETARSDPKTPSGLEEIAARLRSPEFSFRLSREAMESLRRALTEFKISGEAMEELLGSSGSLKPLTHTASDTDKDSDKD